MDSRKASNSPCNPITPCAQSPVYSNENRPQRTGRLATVSGSTEQRSARKPGAVTLTGSNCATSRRPASRPARPLQRSTPLVPVGHASARVSPLLASPPPSLWCTSCCDGRRQTPPAPLL